MFTHCDKCEVSQLSDEKIQRFIEALNKQAFKEKNLQNYVLHFNDSRINKSISRILSDLQQGSMDVVDQIQPEKLAQVITDSGMGEEMKKMYLK